MSRTTTVVAKPRTGQYDMTDDLPDLALVPHTIDPVDLADDIFYRLTPLQRERFRLRFAAQMKATDESTIRQRAYRATK